MFLSCKQKVDNNRQIPNITRPENTCKVNILSSVNGEYAKDLKLTITNCETSNIVFDEDCPYGIAFPKLEAGKHYDFAVKGNDTYSSSLTKNLKIKTSIDDIAMCVCLKHKS